MRSFWHCSSRNVKLCSRLKIPYLFSDLYYSACILMPHCVITFVKYRTDTDTNDTIILRKHNLLEKISFFFFKLKLLAFLLDKNFKETKQARKLRFYISILKLVFNEIVICYNTTKYVRQKQFTYSLVSHYENPMINYAATCTHV